MMKQFEETRDRLIGRLRRAVEAARLANNELAAFEQAHPQGHAALALRAGIGLVLDKVRDGCWQLELN